MEKLPVFEDIDERNSPGNDRFQAIVPAYTFQCSGRVTEWRACVQPVGGGERYYIQFQVWRSTGIDGCYELVDYNTPLDVEESEVSDSFIIDGEGFLIPGRGSAPEYRAVVPVRESQQMQFLSEDVVGYYDKNRDNNTKGGIEGIIDVDVFFLQIWYQKR